MADSYDFVVMSTKKSKKVAKRVTSKASKAATQSESFGVGKRGARYTIDQKNKVVDYVNEYNTVHGRGGQSQAAQKFGLSVLTVASWLRSPHISGTTGYAVRGGSVPAGLNSKVVSLIEISDQLRKLEAEAARLRVKYDSIRSAVQI